SCNAPGTGRTPLSLAPCIQPTLRIIRQWWRATRKRRKSSRGKRSKSAVWCIGKELYHGQNHPKGFSEAGNRGKRIRVGRWKHGRRCKDGKERLCRSDYHERAYRH